MSDLPTVTDMVAAAPCMKSEHFEMRLRDSGPLGFSLRLKGNPEAMRTWSTLDVLLRGGVTCFREAEDWCRSVLEHNGIEVPS